jgi:hypothetical protein
MISSLTYKKRGKKTYMLIQYTRYNGGPLNVDNHKVVKQLPPRNEIAGFALNTFENCLLHFLCLVYQFLQPDSKRPWGQHWFYFVLTLVTIN